GRWRSSGGGHADIQSAVTSFGSAVPAFHFQGRWSFHARPCDRNERQNELNWNQRTNSSGVNSRVGTKPPVSEPQYGIPHKPTLIPFVIWALSAFQVENVSPDHSHPKRCIPA